MKKEILVSVYCLAYNHEKYIRQTLEGFVNQKTNFKYEVFVHDDASTDNTSGIIKEYARKFPDIIIPILQKENQYSKGISISKTIIFPKMHGKYVAVCEGDDYWIDNEKLQIQVDFLEKNPNYVACVHNSNIYNCITNKTKKMYKVKQDYDIDFYDVIEEGSGSYQTSSLLYRKEAMEKRPTFFEDIAPIGDWPTAINLSLKGKIRFINKTMSVYRIFSTGSWTYNNNSNITQHNKKVINFLNSVNKYTKYKYEEKIRQTILRHNYVMNEALGNYIELQNEKYKHIWADKPLLFKIKRYIKRQKIYCLINNRKD